MGYDDWRLRARLVGQRFWQPTGACLACMPGHLGNVVSRAHWEIALFTGLSTGVLVLLLSFTPLLRVFRHRYWNAAAVGCLTAIGDAISHSGRDGSGWREAVVTGLVSGCIALGGAWLLADRARRIRSARGHAGPADAGSRAASYSVNRKSSTKAPGSRRLAVARA